MILSSTVTTPTVSQINASPSVPTSVASTSLNGNSVDETTGINASGPCARLAASGILSAREYAFVDCSEVYLAGKRTTGIYEIW